MTKTLRAPPDHLSVVFGGVQYNAVGGMLRDLPDDVAEGIKAHDSRFVDHAGAAADAGEINASDDPEDLSRPELFARLKSMHAVVSRTATTKELRKILGVEIAKAAKAKDAPEGKPVEFGDPDDMTRADVMAALKSLDVAFDKTASTTALRDQLTIEIAKAKRAQQEAGAAAA